MSAKHYQIRIQPLLEAIFSRVKVESEWIAFQQMRYQYSPRVDIAVGPFSTVSGGDKIDEYNFMLKDVQIRRFLKKIYDYHIENIGNNWQEIELPQFEELILKNENARCFIAFEIENTSSKKHIMGSMVNAASLGRIGIGVAYNESVKATFVRILNYLAFLKRVGKNSYDTTNLLIVTAEQLELILNETNV